MTYGSLFYALEPLLFSGRKIFLAVSFGTNNDPVPNVFQIVPKRMPTFIEMEENDSSSSSSTSTSSSGSGGSSSSNSGNGGNSCTSMANLPQDMLYFLIAAFSATLLLCFFQLMRGWFRDERRNWTISKIVLLIAPLPISARIVDMTTFQPSKNGGSYLCQPLQDQAPNNLISGSLPNYLFFSECILLVLYWYVEIEQTSSHLPLPLTLLLALLTFNASPSCTPLVSPLLASLLTLSPTPCSPLVSPRLISLLTLPPNSFW
jgi:hypothetical protein